MAQDSARPEGQSSSFRDLFSREALPVFSIFFMWGFGTGGLWLVRPLFAYDIGGESVLLAGVVSAASAAPRVLFAPVTGYLVDLWGRKPLIFMGAIGHGAILVGQFYSQSYVQFLLLELAAGMAISFWNVSSNVLVADVTKVANRGRGVAVRNVSQRAGTLAGPVAGGLIAAALGLRYVFLFIAATKIVVLLITYFLVKETKPEHKEPARRWSAPARRRDWSMFRSRSFVALACATLGYGMIGIGPGVFRTFFPLHAEIGAGLSEGQIGGLMSIAGIATLAATVPVGLMLDLQGRKRLLFLGMAVTSVSAACMALTGDFLMALLAVSVFGVGEAVAGGSVQTYAMDLAPPDQRGVFMGTWQVAMNVGQVAGPLGIGVIAELLGMVPALWTMAAMLAAAGAVVLLFAAETRRRQPASA